VSDTAVSDTTTWLCKACGTQYPPSEAPPGACAICEDPRQYVPYDTGQQWLRYDTFLDAHKPRSATTMASWHRCEPQFAIGQRALLVKSNAGNVLWDCTPCLDAAIVRRIGDEGGLAAIAISHPHFYSAMVEWAHTFGCPIFIHEAERKWVMRPDPAVRFWSGETMSFGGGLTLIRCGGHFEGGQVLHWFEEDSAERRARLFSGDIVQVIPDRRFVSFMYSFPNLIPLPPSKVRAVAAALEPFLFDTIHGAWWGRRRARRIRRRPAIRRALRPGGHRAGCPRSRRQIRSTFGRRNPIAIAGARAGRSGPPDRQRDRDAEPGDETDPVGMTRSPNRAAAPGTARRRGDPVPRGSRPVTAGSGERVRRSEKTCGWFVVCSSSARATRSTRRPTG
jgi:glyoxylase-like metal-dependent hydrolase (beta-lactamase superfamily II)